MANKIPFFEYPRLFTDDEENLIRIFKDVGRRGAFIMQSDVREFEESLASFVGSPYAIGVANATDGLEIAWMAVNLRPGDEVICSAHTMLATASSIRMAGGIPVPVEIGSDGLIDPDAVEASLTSRTVGIMPTQLNGRTCNMDKIMKIARKHHLYVVEDAAQALGSSFKGQHAGTFGDAAAISFFPAKVLGCLGDAGAVITGTQDIYDRCYQLHDHGRDPDGEVRSWGRNSRLDNLQAAFLNDRLKKYASVIIRRREIASIYQEQLKSLEELTLPPAPDSDDDHFDVYQNYEIQSERRDELKNHLAQCGIGTLVQWGGKALHQFEALGMFKNLPKTSKFFDMCLMLPMNMFISDADVLYICDSIRKFYRG